MSRYFSTTFSFIRGPLMNVPVFSASSVVCAWGNVSASAMRCAFGTLLCKMWDRNKVRVHMTSLLPSLKFRPVGASGCTFGSPAFLVTPVSCIMGGGKWKTGVK